MDEARDESEAALDALMARLARGDRAAFEPLFRALHPRARRLARSRLPAASADDAAQSALLKVFAQAARFVPGRPVLPWLYAIVANEIRATRRQVRGADTSPNVELANAETHEDALLQEELLRALEQAIAALDEPSAETIRALLGRAPRPALESPTFRKRVSRAYVRLRVLLGDLR